MLRGRSICASVACVPSGELPEIPVPAVVQIVSEDTATPRQGGKQQDGERSDYAKPTHEFSPPHNCMGLALLTISPLGCYCAFLKSQLAVRGASRELLGGGVLT